MEINNQIIDAVQIVTIKGFKTLYEFGNYYNWKPNEETENRLLKNNNLSWLFTTAGKFAYSKKIAEEELLPHVYLNYLAIMFGGQMMKAKTPGSGRMYEFDGDMREIAGTIRAIQKDEWADEANKALDFNISILDELQRLSESASNEVEVDGGEGA